MAWDAPSSVTTGDLITAATWNQDVVDNAQYLYDERLTEIRSIWARDNGAGYNTTTSASYVVADMELYYLGSEIDDTEVSIYHAAKIAIPGGGTMNATLYFDGSEVTDAEVSTTSTSTYGVVVMSADIAGNVNWAGGDALIEQYIKRVSGGGTARSWGFWLIVAGS